MGDEEVNDESNEQKLNENRKNVQNETKKRSAAEVKNAVEWNQIEEKWSSAMDWTLPWRVWERAQTKMD